VRTSDGEELSVTSSEFRAYAERVFRLQNEVATDLAFALDAEPVVDASTYARLERADDRLFDACAALNEIAARRRDGARRRPFADARAAQTVPGCERAATAARDVLASTQY
jgi:hypothetical protein